MATHLIASRLADTRRGDNSLGSWVRELSGLYNGAAHGLGAENLRRHDGAVSHSSRVIRSTKSMGKIVE